MEEKQELKRWGSMGKKTPLNRTSKICPLWPKRAQGQYYRPPEAVLPFWGFRALKTRPGAVLPPPAAVLPFWEVFG